MQSDSQRKRTFLVLLFLSLFKGFKNTGKRKNEKKNDAIVQETLKKMDEMQKEREQSISDREIDNIMKQKYGNNYRTEQSANINGWNFK